jgi:hypothetical protein
VLEPEDRQGKILGAGALDGPDGIGKTSDPVGQEQGETIRGDDDDAGIDPARRQVVPQVGDVD